MLFTTLFSSFVFAAEEEWVIADEITINVDYHVQTYGDRTTEGDGMVSFGTTGEGKRLERFNITLEGAPADMELVGMAHVQTYGDMPEKGFKAGEVGTAGEAKRIEGVAFKLVKKGTDELYPGYTISYQVHMKGYGWGASAEQNWYKGNEDAFASDGEFAGTRGLARHIEEVSMIIEKEAKLAVKDVAADNLKQVEVEFNQNVEGNDAVENKDNYALEDSKGKDVEDVIKVDVDGNTAVLTLEEAVDNQTTAYLVINKAVLGEEAEFEVRFRDFTAPTVDDAEVIGENTIKVVFSEPMDAETLKEARNYNIESADGKTSYSVRSVTPQKNDTQALIELRRNLKDGDELVLTVKNAIKDYANFRVPTTEFDLVVVEDNSEIEVIDYKNATEEGVILVFNKNIKVDNSNVKNYYHTNSKNTIDKKDGVKADGNELVLVFKENELPKGTAYIYVDGDSLVDYWGNTNEQTIVYEVNIAGDTEAPAIKKVEFEAPNTLTVEFSKRVNEKTAEDEDNYTIVTESDGKEVKDPTIYRATLGDDEKTVTLRLSGKTLEAGKYLLQVDGIKDLRGNELENAEKAFTYSGKALDEITATLYTYVGKNDTEHTIVVDFGRKMDVSGERYSIDTLENYTLKVGTGQKTLASLGSDYDVELEVSDDEKSIEIIIEVANGKDKLVLDEMFVSRVKDATGALSSAFVHTVTINDKSDEDKRAVKVNKVEATALDTIVVELDGALDYLEEYDFDIAYATTSGTSLDIVDDVELSADGKKVTITLSEELTYDAKYKEKEDSNPVAIALMAKDETGSLTKYDGALVLTGNKVADKIAPEFYIDYNNNADGYKYGYNVVETTGDGEYIKEFKLKFTEELKTVTSGTALDILKGSFSLSDLNRSDYNLEIVKDEVIFTITNTAKELTKITVKLTTTNEDLVDLNGTKVKLFETTVYND